MFCFRKESFQYVIIIFFFIYQNLFVQNFIRKIFLFKIVRFPFLRCQERPASIIRVDVNTVKLRCAYDSRGGGFGEIATEFRRFGSQCQRGNRKTPYKQAYLSCIFDEPVQIHF